ncbi:MAG: hypothetical protein AVDCRST_MAG71-2110 [uncultured Lysobacter sp.]|uniref:Uncharacterized protein n=1 Tax=uncultured Lysobacter sp. TaxID=271060 RepID=A0A6J4LNW4_9GAMM|nr:MAG: hypothetical protein AVDCRST_MAG71-2110 [uncultured Lysobacter sp.]
MPSEGDCGRLRAPWAAHVLRAAISGVIIAARLFAGRV